MKTFQLPSLQVLRGLIPLFLTLAYGSCASVAVAQEGPPGPGAAPLPPPSNAAPQGTNMKRVLRITAVRFGDRSRNETCDAFAYFHHLCHEALEEKEKALAIKDDAVDPSYCAAKRIETNKNQRYEGVDLCGYKPSPIGQNTLYIEYKCASGKDAASAKENLNASQPRSAALIGWVEWVRLSCDVSQ